MEPTYPGVVGHYVNLGDFYDKKGLREQKEVLIRLHHGYKGCYESAYRCIHAAQQVQSHGESMLLTEAVGAKLAKRAAGILSREVKKKSAERGRIQRRFLGGLSCQGELCCYETAQNICGRIYELQDVWGLAAEMLSVLQEGVLAAGYAVISCLAPETPEKIAHLLIPELSLGFVTTKPARPLKAPPYRRIRMRSMADEQLLKQHKGKLRFLRRVAEELRQEGIAQLRHGKEIHDEMEAVYRPFVNFKGADKLTRGLIEEIRQLL